MIDSTLIFFGCLGVGIFCGGVFAGVAATELYFRRFGHLQPTPRHKALARVLSANQESKV